VPAALLLFAQGVSGVVHTYRAHRMVHDVEASADARQMLLELQERVDRLAPEEAEKVLRVLLAQYPGVPQRQA
jgi:hypothetical protein